MKAVTAKEGASPARKVVIVVLALTALFGLTFWSSYNLPLVTLPLAILFAISSTLVWLRVPWFEWKPRLITFTIILVVNLIGLTAFRTIPNLTPEDLGLYWLFLQVIALFVVFVIAIFGHGT